MKKDTHSIPHVRTKDLFDFIAVDSGKTFLVGFLRVEPGYDQKIDAMQIACNRVESDLTVLVLGDDAETILLKELALEGTPTFMLFHEGEEKGRILGNADASRLAQFIQTSLVK